MLQVADNRSRHIRWFLALIALAFCALLMWATAINSGLNHNEQMYVAAARLWQQYRLYSDFAYLQAPLLPIVNGWLFWLSDNEHLLLLARIHVLFWAVVALYALYSLSLRLSRSELVGAAAAAVLGSQPVFLSNVAESSNYIMPLGLTLVSLWTLIVARDDAAPARLRSVCAAVSGLAIGCAVSCKSFYAIVALGVLVMAVDTTNRQLIAGWAAGAVLGALPLAYYAVQDPTAFYFGNLDYHLANADFREANRYGLPLSFQQRLKFMLSAWRKPSLILLTVYCMVALAALRPRNIPTSGRRFLYVAIALTVLACIAALLPSPAYLQYFAMPYACLLIAAVVAAGLHGRIGSTVFIAVCVIGVLTSPATFRLGKLLRKGSAPARVEREAKSFDDQVDCTSDKFVATLSPILPLEAGCSIYPELATGPFAFRVADQRTHELQDDVGVVGPSRLHQLLRDRKPYAILVGFEPRHDGVFEDYARQEGYVQLDQRFLRRGRVWLAPEAH